MVFITLIFFCLFALFLCLYAIEQGRRDMAEFNLRLEEKRSNFWRDAYIKTLNKAQ